MPKVNNPFFGQVAESDLRIAFFMGDIFCVAFRYLKLNLIKKIPVFIPAFKFELLLHLVPASRQSMCGMGLDSAIFT